MESYCPYRCIVFIRAIAVRSFAMPDPTRTATFSCDMSWSDRVVCLDQEGRLHINHNPPPVVGQPLVAMIHVFCFRRSIGLVEVRSLVESLNRTIVCSKTGN